MVRFFVSQDELRGDSLTLTGENAQHAKVLRLKVNEEVLLCDGEGNECRCVIREVSSGALSLEVLERGLSLSEARVRVSVYMAFPSARCISKPDDKSLKKKLERWQKIAASAAEQSGRGRIPQVLVLGSFGEALKRASGADKALMFYENEHAVTLRMVLETGEYETVSLLTGPEGGLEEKEVEQARQAGLQVCTLGKRILRCETAPLCALSAVMYASGEF